MIEEINDLKKELDSYLSEKKEIDESSLEKKLFALIKKSLTNNVTEMEIGNYYLNINPKQLKVTYESLSTYLEISNQDIYEECEIEDNCYYYIVRNEDNKYDEKTPVIKVSNTILVVDPYITENLFFELLNGENLNIKDYLKDDKSIKLENNHQAIINKYINLDERRINEQDYLDLDKVMLVKKQLNGLYKPTYREDKEQYKDILPNLEINKKIINVIYNCLLNFYKKYV